MLPHGLHPLPSLAAMPSLHAPDVLSVPAASTAEEVTVAAEEVLHAVAFPSTDAVVSSVTLAALAPKKKRPAADGAGARPQGELTEVRV